MAQSERSPTVTSLPGRPAGPGARPKAGVNIIQSTAGVGSRAEQNDLIEETRVFWQSRTDRVLTREDGREIIENLTGFFRVLSEWDRVERARTKKTHTER
jgi:hypothetical protein